MAGCNSKILLPHVSRWATGQTKTQSPPFGLLVSTVQSSAPNDVTCHFTPVRRRGCFVSKAVQIYIYQKKNLLITFDMKSDQPKHKHLQKQAIDQSDPPEPQRESRNTPGGRDAAAVHQPLSPRNRTIVSPQRLENLVTDRSRKRKVRRRLLQPEHRTATARRREVPPPSASAAERAVIATR